MSTPSYIKQRHQTLKSIVTSNQLSTNTLGGEFKGTYIYHFWSGLDGRSTVVNHKRCVILVSELQFLFRAAKYIITYYQSYTTPFLDTSGGHIYITSGRIRTVEVLFEIIQDVFFWFLSSEIIIEAIDCLRIEQHNFTPIVHTTRYHQYANFTWRGTRECYAWTSGKGWSNCW